jgi:hypothetical protein
MAPDRPHPETPPSRTPTHLAASVATLLTHLHECEICREVGVAHCSIVEHLACVVRDDRRHLANG